MQVRRDAPCVEDGSGHTRASADSTDVKRRGLEEEEKRQELETGCVNAGGGLAKIVCDAGIRVSDGA